MTILTSGTDVQATEESQIDTVVPFSTAANLTLIPGTHRVVIADPNGAPRTYTLPDAASNESVRFLIKRNTLSDQINFVTLAPAGSDKIDGGTSFILGNANEYVEIISDGTDTWRVINSRTVAIAVMQFIDTSTTQILTTGYQIVDSWNTDTFNTAGRILSDEANNRLEVRNVANEVQDGYKVSFEGNIQYTNNVDLTFAVFVDGVETTAGLTVSGKGSNDVLVNFLGIVGVLASGGIQDIDLRVNPNSGGTITYFSKTSLIAERIGG